MPEIMTHEMKYGRYETVCTTFLNHLSRSSLSSSAKTMDDGNAKIIFKAPRIKVLRTRFRNPREATA